MQVFIDRREAGRELGRWLLRRRPAGDLLVLALPRGGVPVAFEVAQALNVPLDVLLVGKLGAPLNPEFAVGAIAAGGAVAYNDEALAGLALHQRVLKPIIAREQADLSRRERVYREGRPPLELEGKTVIIVDDGMATGSMMRAAVTAVKALGAQRAIVAVPTASRRALDELGRSADLVAGLSVPEPYTAVGDSYRYFPELSDCEVVELLAAHQRPPARPLI
jgi:predicted phosphoribosyltransferase